MNKVFQEKNVKLVAKAQNSFIFPTEETGQDAALIKKTRYWIKNPSVKVIQTDRTLHFYLFKLEHDYSISCDHGKVTYRPEEHLDVDSVTIPLWDKNTTAWGLHPTQDTTTTHMKLLVTTKQDGEEELFYQQFLQSGLKNYNKKVGN